MHRRTFCQSTVAAAVREYYKEMELKNQYDPANLFRLNANIKPGV